MQLKVGGRFHLKLNISKRPIANKYREGKMQRTLKRECKGLEIAKREAVGNSSRVASRRRECQHQLVARQIALGEVASARLAGVRVFNPEVVSCD